MEKRALSLSLGLAAAMAIASPARSEAATTTPFALSSAALAKSEAILGGETSALARIMASQQGLPMASVRPLQPASRPTLSGLRPVLRDTARFSPAVRSGRPDLFGSIALSVSRTPLDRDWRRVERLRIGGSHAAFARSLRDLDPAERVEAVNLYVNKRVRFVDDSRQFGESDVWLSASETLRRGRGDCEDYAIAKLQMLRAAGLSDDDLYLAVVKDLVRRSDHAVLVVRAGNRMLLLDNGTDEVLDSEKVRDYRPVLTFAASGSWTHGYRRPAASSVQIAEADLERPVPASSH